jgi:hypothetical protein
MIKPVPDSFLSRSLKIKAKSFVTAISMMATYAAYSGIAISSIKAPAALNTAAKDNTAVAKPGKQTVPANISPNDVEVTNVIPELGTMSRLWSDQNQIITTITNIGTQDQANVLVKLTVSGPNAETLSQVVPFLAAGSSTTLNFTASIIETASQTIEVTLPDDDDNSNNTKQVNQEITCNHYGYTSTEPIYGGFGFGSSTGIVSAQYKAPGIPIQLTGVTVHLSNDNSNIGKSITGVLLDDVGNIIADSEPFYATASDLNTTIQLPFYFSASLDPNAVFYAGIRQDDPDQAPVGVALPATALPNRYFTFADNGGPATHRTDLGSLKIGVIASVGAELTRSESGQIIAGQPVTFTATPGFPEYIFKVNGVTTQSSTDNVFTYAPAPNDEVHVEINSNGCTSVPIGNYVMTVKNITPANGILYVNKNNPTPGDGSSWTGALRELADALRWAKSKEANWTAADPLQIWVAGGTYYPLYSPADDNFGKVDSANNAFLLVKNVKLYGGFGGTEATLSDRNLSLTFHKSILSGDYDNDDIITGSGIDLAIDRNKMNSCHVVIASGDVGDALMDGFTITGGNGDTEGMGDIEVNNQTISRLGGGGIHNYQSSPSYSNLIIKGNRAAYHGGGVYNDHSYAIFTNILIVDNLSDVQGGGMANTNISEPILTNLTIVGNNAAVEGGGYANVSSTTQIRNTIVYGNNVVPYDQNSTPFILYSLIEGMPEDPNYNILDGNQDPLFNNPAAGNYTLKKGSVAINSGSFLFYIAGQTPDLTGITTDLAGKPRISGSTTDLGAYESSNQDQHITAQDINRTYGDADFELTAIASSGLPVTYSLANNDAVDLYQDAQDGNKWKIKIKKAGSVVITVSQPGDANFDPAADIDIQLLINRKELTVTADDKTRIYGEANPTFTISYAGFAGNDGVQNITAPDITTTATPSSAPGTYPIILKNGDAVNYDLKFVHGLLTVEGALITVNQQPTDQSICAGSIATFTTAATTASQINITYQWQQSTDNNTWNNINGANKAQLNASPGNDMYYRCALSVPGRTTNSNAVKLVVKAFEKPVINLPNSVCLAEGKVTLNASLPGGVFSGPGVSGGTWYIDTLRPGLHSVTYSYSNNNGCSTTVSKTTSLSLCGEKNLVSVTKANPNPTNGPVTVKVLVTENARQNVIVSNSFGQQVLTKQVQLRKGWNHFTLDLTQFRAGIYFITLAGYGEGPATVVSIMKQ